MGLDIHQGDVTLELSEDLCSANIESEMVCIVTD